MPAAVWAIALIYGVAGAMCLFAAAFPVSATAPRTLATVIGVVLLVCSGGFLRFGTALPPLGLQVAAAAGTIANSILVLSCTTDYGVTLNCFAYLWVAIYAGQFFEPRAARIQCGLIALASAVALAASGVSGTVTLWVLVAGSAFLAGEILTRLNTRLRAQLVTDQLTGLLNRAGFIDAARWVRGLADRGGLAVSLAMIDLDEFKQVNDLHGHAAGDKLLAELGEAWRAELRESEVLGRFGGDEFALLLAGTDREDAEQVLRRLRSASTVDWSVGVVAWRRGESFDRAMARADEELYRAKRRAREQRATATVVA
ncbi:MAG TPA: GGDEF domain-containing protein [Solirubrobacterales bacterium]|nr:GGDEF domain-containing protein [Solirubrobacterales bacterium]